MKMGIADRISSVDYDQIVAVLGGWREPDFIITNQNRPGVAEAAPYIYRWYVIPRNVVGANVYLHLQVADDPDLNLHDHPWDNQSVIIGGQGYREIYQHVYHGRLWLPEPTVRELHVGQVAHRRAEEAHRLELLGDYSVSIFSTGPVDRAWGFWEPGGWRQAISDGEFGTVPVAARTRGVHRDV